MQIETIRRYFRLKKERRNHREKNGVNEDVEKRMKKNERE